MHRGNSQLYSITLVGAANNPAQLSLGGSSGETPDASAALRARDVARGDLVFVGSRGCQDFTLLGLRHLEKVKGPPELRCDLIELCGRDPEVAVGLLKAERCRAGLGGREMERPTRNVADPQRSHELEAGSLPRFLVCHCRSCGFLDFWPTMGFFTTASLK
jgi:hypothetical protein